MTIEARLVALAQAVGADVKALRLANGDLTSLTTTTKTSLVAAVNELVTLIASGGGAGIDDDASEGGAVTWSVDKITTTIAAAKTALKNELVDGSAAALDTLAELAAALGNDPSFATTIATGLANRVRFDEAQGLNAAQKTQARDNIGAAAAADLTTLQNGIGNYDHDFLADYNTAKA